MAVGWKTRRRYYAQRLSIMDFLKISKKEKRYEE
jgi:hypothetical protein